jgi:hypothetical protein
MQHDPDFHSIGEGDRILRERREADSKPMPRFIIRALLLITIFIVVIGYLQIHGEYPAAAAWCRHHPLLILGGAVAVIFRSQFFRLAKRLMA